MQYHLQLSTVALVSVTLRLITSQSLSLHSTLFYGAVFLSRTSRQLLFLIIKMIWQPAWQACLSRPLTDWQPIPAVTSSCLTPLRSSICHFSCSARSPLPPTCPLCPFGCARQTKKKATRGRCVPVWQSADLTPWNKAVGWDPNALQHPSRLACQ